MHVSNHESEQAAPGEDLRSQLSFFVTKASVRLLLGACAVVGAWRVLVGGWRLSDLVIVAVILGLQPFTEWVIHVVVLHFRPRRVGGITIDLHAARKHRAHHLDPSDPHKVFIPLVDLAVLAATVAVVVWLAIPDAGGRLTAAFVAAAMALTYEWTHFLIHTPYRPRSRYVRSIWRSHRLHHFRNEHYWLGVTSNLGDRVLRTYPDRSAVPVSPTARTLGVDES